MSEHKPLVYVPPAAIAARLGVSRSAVTNWLTRGTAGMPEPDAYLEGTRAGEPVLTPIWSADRANEVVTWALDRMKQAAHAAEVRAQSLRSVVDQAESR